MEGPILGKNILSVGIAFNVHDSSASFALGNKVILVLEAERFFRQKKKKCNKFEMDQLLQHGLEILGKTLEDISYVAMTTLENPYLGLGDIFNSDSEIPRDLYWKVVEILGKKIDTLIVNHHLAHAGIFYATKYKKSLIVSCDGGGDYKTGSKLAECLAVFKAGNDKIKRIQIDTENCVTGKFYALCSNFIYDSKNSEGTLMAYAALGEVSEVCADTLHSISKSLESSTYEEGRKILVENFPGLKGTAHFESKESKDFAATVQKLFTERKVGEISTIIDNNAESDDVIILTGGVSLNLEMNSEVAEKYPLLGHFVPPCCDDTGQSLGALCILINEVFKSRSEVKFPYLGEGQVVFDYDFDTLDKAIDILLKNGVLIVHNGKSEIGPRALGNRSFIGRPDSIEVKKILSEKIKQRQSYRPVAPIVLEDKVGEYFTGPKTSPFMLYRYGVVDSQKEKVIGSIHVDGSARVQTVTHDSNPFMYDLIKRFGDRTGVYVLLNTSLNLKGDPISNKIEESIEIYKHIDNPKGIVYNGKLLYDQN